MKLTKYAMRVYSKSFPFGYYVIELGWYASGNEAMSDARYIYDNHYSNCDRFSLTIID